MWFYNTRNQDVEISDRNIYNIEWVWKNIDNNIYIAVKEERRTRGHGATRARKQCILDIRKFSFHKEQYMNGTDYQLIV